MKLVCFNEDRSPIYVNAEMVTKVIRYMVGDLEYTCIYFVGGQYQEVSHDLRTTVRRLMGE